MLHIHGNGVVSKSECGVVVRVSNIYIDLLNESNLPALIPGSCVSAWNM